MALQSVVQWLLPKDNSFYVLLEKLAAASFEAAEALARFKVVGSKAAEVCEQVQRIEHRADGLVREMEDALAKTFVTPIDREDLHQLSSEIDEVIDLTNLAARAAVLYGVHSPTEPVAKLMDILLNCTRIVKDALPLLRARQYARLVEECRKLRILEKDADTVYRTEVSRLFHASDIEARVLLREKEMLEDLERAVDQCDELAGTLTNVAVKNG